MRGHSQSLNCDRKGREFWWTMARLAGWPGPNGVLVGDLNCDGAINFGDINPFVLYLADFAPGRPRTPVAIRMNGDINGDGTYPDFGDINPFVALLSGSP